MAEWLHLRQQQLQLTGWKFREVPYSLHPTSPSLLLMPSLPYRGLLAASTARVIRRNFGPSHGTRITCAVPPRHATGWDAREERYGSRNYAAGLRYRGWRVNFMAEARHEVGNVKGWSESGWNGKGEKSWLASYRRLGPARPPFHCTPVHPFSSSIAQQRSTRATYRTINL